jgi:8-oxo-dGTP diphosphatase
MVQVTGVNVVCAIIVDEEGNVLACQRPAGKALALKWEFPGGKVEAGESPEQAIVRELQEELAVDVRILQRLTDVDWDYGRGPFCLIPFICEIERGEPQACEHAEIRWCHRNDLACLDMAAADGPVLLEYLSSFG